MGSYVSRGEQHRVDWAGALSEFGEKLEFAIGTRDRERAAYLQEAQNTEQDIIAKEETTNKTLQEFSLGGQNMGRDMIYEWKKMADAGEMTPTEYTRRLNNLQNSFTTLNKSISSFDQHIIETQKRTMPGKDGKIEASLLEIENNKHFSELADLSNREIYVNPTSGKTYIIKRGENGEVIESRDVDKLLNPGNILDKRVYVTDSVTPLVEQWKDHVKVEKGGLGSSLTTTDPRLKEDYIRSKNATIKTIISTPRSTASVLTDNGTMSPAYYKDGVTYVGNAGYGYYKTEDEKIAKVEQKLIEAKEIAEEAGLEWDEKKARKELNSMMIQLEEDATGVWQPSLTEEQFEAAKSRVGMEIEMQLGHKEAYHAGRAPSTSGSGGKDEGAGTYATYVALDKAWRAGNKAKAEAAMNSLNPRYTFEQTSPGVWDVYTVKTPGQFVEQYNEDTEQYEKVYQAETLPQMVAKGVTNARDLAPFVWQRSTKVTQHQRFDDEKKAYRAATNQGSGELD